MSSILIIGDSHAKPGVPNDRYTWLGRLIQDRLPDIIVDMGDFADMPSLSHYDKGKASGEGKRLSDDLAAAREARLLVTAHISDTRGYKPRMIALGGNHEYRICKKMNDDPSLKGMYSQDVSGAAGLGWEWYDYLNPVVVEGITFTHHVHDAMGKPISVKANINTVLKNEFHSFVTAHNHERHISHLQNSIGKGIMGISAGCYFEHTEYYAKNSNNRWDRCLILLRNVEDGFTQDIEVISLKRVKEMYA